MGAQICCLLRCILVIIFVGVLLLQPLAVGQAAERTVETVTVSVSAAGNPPERVIKRMTVSVTTVGEEMLAGRDVVAVTESKASYERLIKEIFDRVLVGYSVESVKLTPGTLTQLDIHVVPWGEVVSEVKVEISLGGLSPAVADLIKADTGNVAEQIRESLLGLPIDAVDWAGGVSKGVIREILANQLPEFYPTIDITSGASTVVRISLAAAGPIVHETNVLLRSRTLPNILLYDLKPVVEEVADSLRGLPIAYIERRRGLFMERLNAKVAQQPVTRRYQLQCTAEIRTGTVTEIVLKAETGKLNITLEGIMDVGRTKDNTFVKFHGGEYINKRDELFLEVQFIPSTVSWKFEPGWGHKFGETTFAGFRYNLSDNHSKLWFKQYIGPYVMLRAERDPINGDNEFGVRYRLHQFLSVEYVFTAHENWLRLIGNL